MLIGLPTLRLRGDYIAIVTLAFGEIIGRIVINGDEITQGAAVGGRRGRVRQGANFSADDRASRRSTRSTCPFIEPFKSLDLSPWYFVGARAGR